MYLSMYVVFLLVSLVAVVNTMSETHARHTMHPGGGFGNARVNPWPVLAVLGYSGYFQCPGYPGMVNRIVIRRAKQTLVMRQHVLLQHH